MCQDFINGANTEIIISDIYVVSSDLIFFSNGHLTIKNTPTSLFMLIWGKFPSLTLFITDLYVVVIFGK